MNRRQFIRISALAGRRTIADNAVSCHAWKSFMIATLHKTDGALGDLLKIAPDGQVSYQFIKHEMGQGVSTAMAMIISGRIMRRLAEGKNRISRHRSQKNFKTINTAGTIRAEAVPSFTSGIH